MVWIELMKVKANPNSSPIEGGGHLVLLFYNPLPLGKKIVVFCSQKNRDLMYAQEAVQENMMALICQIPEYPYPEEVQLQVYNYNQIIARTTFVFYQQSLPMHPPSDMILQILSSQLQSHFPNGGMGGANGGRSNGDQMSGSGGYNSYIPNSMYHLLLGACRLGCEPLVHCLLSSPVMEDLTQEQMKEAYECALSNGHESLSEVLMELVVLHEMSPTIPSSNSSHGYISRGLSNGQSEQVQHVPAYYAVLDELQQGGNSPQARAETVLKQLLTAMKEKANDEPEKQNEVKQEEEVKEEPVADTQPEVEDVTTPIIEITPNLTVDKLTVKMEETTLCPKRRLSSTAILKRQSNSIGDEDDELHHSDLTLQSPAVFHSRESWAEVNDTVPDLVSHKKKHPYTQQSDADSAIGMSFEEELSSLLNSEMQRRRSSLMLPPDMFSQHNDSITIKMTTDVGIEVANGLEWDGCIVVTEDYPPGQDKKILCKGDRIVQVGDKLIRGMSAVDFSELFQSEATNGANIRIIPANNTTQQLPSETSPMPQQRILKRTPSEQFSDGIKTKINQLISIRPSSIERRVTLSRSSSSGYPIKMIGGKNVGVFISDVRSDVTQVQVYPGDEILEINGRSTRGLTLYDANQMVQTTSGDLRLTVVENKAKFFHVREQVEIDSMYLRSRIDYKPISNREMTLQKGSLLRVVNTCSLTNSWVAWSIDEITGVEIQLKKILPPTIAKMQFGCDAYERVERSDSLFKRPLCVTGPDSDRVAELVSDKPQFNLCENFEQMLGICSKSTDRAVMSIKDPAHLELLKALQPIVFQTPLDSAPLLEQSKFSQVSVNMFLTGQTSSELAQEAITQMHRLQDLPIFKPVGVI